MGDEEQSERLRALGRNPAEAIKHWSQLDQGERVVVVTYMSLHYDVAFTKLFVEETKHRKRPEETIVVTNDRLLTPAKLQGAGYQRRGDFGGTIVWVHPSGKQIWLMAPPRALPPGAQKPGHGEVPKLRPDEHYQVPRARDYVEAVEAELQECYAWVRRVQANPGGPTYLQDLFNALQSVNSAVKHAIEGDEMFDKWAENLNASDKAKIDELKQRLMRLRRDPMPPDIVEAREDLEEMDPDQTLLNDWVRRQIEEQQRKR